MRDTIRPALLAAGLVLAGCSSAGPANRPAEMPEPAAEQAQSPAHDHAAMQQITATAGPGYTVADVRFMQGMIGHHAQAVEMAALVPDRNVGEPLTRLAEKIDISQRDEIAFMQRWLRDRDQAVPEAGHGHGMDMPGMLTPEQMARLAAANGSEFERLFLTFMIQHHRGALVMVETLFDSPGAGQESEIFRFATDVDADQRDEIWVMQTMFDAMDTNRGNQSR